MQETFRDSAISLKNKEIMAISLSLLSKCEPCLKIHLEKARELGASEDEINESVDMATAFGGAPTLMFYKSIVEKE
jgi:AhpD family alkylhydroperoxidase